MPKIALFKKCIACNSPDLSDLEKFRETFLTKCNKCGLVFTRRMPSDTELQNYYASYGSSHFLSPITIKRYNELLDSFERYRITNNLLDIGCGLGYFLVEAKKRGWNVYGSEYGDKLVKACQDKGILMHSGSITDFQTPIKFDVVTSFEVIEHINTPIDEITKINRLLREKGLFYCTTPNFNSLMRYYLSSQYNVISYPEHLTYYTPSTLNKLLSNHGFVKTQLQTTGISLTRIRTSQGKSKEKIVSQSSSDEQIRNKIEQKKYLRFAKKIVNLLLSISHLGMTIKASYVKNTEQ